MQCRSGCGACCIAPSITRPYYGMPHGKPAGVRCVHLDDAMNCRLFNDPRRPALCAAFRAEPDICGDSREQALRLIGELEVASQSH
ncbi:YkgJ family cysteine cluster protein [Parahaliea mediterranea]|uniref:YkgJ family cysteine cluster protein n=1 Tax=Parahaliea mediterranea TaxID=651086 RepID=UPI000E2EDA07|nr:YkgJ family cysteine cluster protein [Parahaliea mediterranea]